KGKADCQLPCMILVTEVGDGELIAEADNGSHPVPDRESAKDQSRCHGPLVFVFCRSRAVYPMGVAELDLGPEIRETIDLERCIPDDRHADCFFVSIRNTRAHGALNVEALPPRSPPLTGGKRRGIDDLLCRELLTSSRKGHAEKARQDVVSVFLVGGEKPILQE